MREQINNLDKVLSTLDLDIISWEPILWKRVQTTPAYIVRAREGKFFLKLTAPTTTRKQTIIRLLFGNLALKNSLIVYASLHDRIFSKFQYPKLVKTDGKSYLLLEFIPIQSNCEQGVTHDALITSLLEFQGSGGLFKKGFLETTLLYVSRKPALVLLRRIVGGLRKRCGLYVSLKCIKVMWTCYKNQNRLNKPIILHNDFHHNNIIVDTFGNIYIFDFEKVHTDNRWILIDIVHYSVSAIKFEIDLELIKNYLKKINGSFKNLGNINVIMQLRIALLLRISQMIISSVPSDSVREKYDIFFRQTLLDDYACKQWFKDSGLCATL